MFKFIISPEFGDRVNHEKLTRDVMRALEKDTGVKMQWVAVTHRNTAHPHTHVALRGVLNNGKEFRLSKQQLNSALRLSAQRAVTEQLGYRTRQDMILAAQREVEATRYTSLDRTLEKSGTVIGDSRLINQLPKYATTPQLVQRLQVLQTMGLAQIRDGKWFLSADLQPQLRAMQMTTDRQRSIRQGLLPVSDSRIPVVVTRAGSLNGIEGRILGHGQEEATGRSFMVLESTDGKLHYVHHDRDMELLRGRGELRAGHYAKFNVKWQRGGGRWQSTMTVKDFGDAERLLSDPAYLRRAAALPPAPEGMGGWLGRQQKALASVVARQPGQSISATQLGR